MVTPEEILAAALSNNPYNPPASGRSPINELPPELLAHIFILGAQDEEEEDEDEGSEDESEDEEDEVEFEVLVSHVCKRWRDLALDIPSLWANIDFEEGAPFEKSRIYLERSKQAPLTISIDRTLDDEEDEDEEEEDEEETAMQELRLMRNMQETKTILDMVKPHISHTRSLEIMVSDYHLMHHVLMYLGECPGAPQLEVLQLYHYEDTEEMEHFWPAEFKNQDFVLFHGHAPRLTHVALWGVHVNWERSPFLAGLQDLELAYHAQDVRPSYKDFARILRQSPELATLAICSSGPAGGPVEWLASAVEEQKVSLPSTVISLPSVENLVLAYLEADYVRELVDRLSLPSLVTLALDFDGDDDYSNFLLSLSRPAPTTGKAILSGIKSLKLSGFPCHNVDAIRTALNTLSNVTSLNLNFVYLGIEWFNVLMEDPPPGQPPLLPRLDTLSTTGIDGVRLRQLETKRRTSGHLIRHLYVNTQDDVSEEDEAWFKTNLHSFEYFEGSDDEEDEAIVEVEVDEEGYDFNDYVNFEPEDDWEDVD